MPKYIEMFAVAAEQQEPESFQPASEVEVISKCLYHAACALFMLPLPASATKDHHRNCFEVYSNALIQRFLDNPTLAETEGYFYNRP